MFLKTFDQIQKRRKALHRCYILTAICRVVNKCSWEKMQLLCPRSKYSDEESTTTTSKQPILCAARLVLKKAASEQPTRSQKAMARGIFGVRRIRKVRCRRRRYCCVLTADEVLYLTDDGLLGSSDGEQPTLTQYLRPLRYAIEMTVILLTTIA